MKCFITALLVTILISYAKFMNKAKLTDYYMYLYLIILKLSNIESLS